MTKLFATIMAAGVLFAGNGWTGCAHSEDQLTPIRGSMQRAVVVAAMSCGDVALGSRIVFYRAGEPQHTDAALLTFVLLLQALRPDDPHKKVVQ